MSFFLMSFSEHPDGCMHASFLIPKVTLVTVWYPGCVFCTCDKKRHLACCEWVFSIISIELYSLNEGCADEHYLYKWYCDGGWYKWLETVYQMSAWRIQSFLLLTSFTTQSCVVCLAIRRECPSKATTFWKSISNFNTQGRIQCVLS